MTSTTIFVNCRDGFVTVITYRWSRRKPKMVQLGAARAPSHCVGVVREPPSVAIMVSRGIYGKERPGRAVREPPLHTSRRHDSFLSEPSWAFACSTSTYHITWRKSQEKHIPLDVSSGIQPQAKDYAL